MLQIPPDKIGLSQTRQIVQPAATELTLNIQHVVLQDINIADSSMFIHALQQELTQLLSQSTPLVLGQDCQIDSLQREAIVVPIASSSRQDSHQLARPIAQAIYLALADNLTVS